MAEAQYSQQFARNYGDFTNFVGPGGISIGHLAIGCISSHKRFLGYAMGMNALKPWHLLILAVVFVVLFGAKRLPDSARSLGRSLRIFKSEVQEMNKDDSDGDQKTDPNSDR